MSALLERIELDEALARAAASSERDLEAESSARRIVANVRSGGDAALRSAGLEFGDLEPEQDLSIERCELEAALARVPPDVRALLERTAARIERFARAQRDALRDFELETEWGRCGQRWVALERAGCYAPGGRYPLPSSVLMTAIPARVAGVRQVLVASPRPNDVTLAAAAVAGADAVLRAGGAQAVAALAYGTGSVPRVDVVVGPGNRFVTAAKRLVAGDVAIDMLAGPSELVVVADATSDPDCIAADLLAQAEHDPRARPILLALDARVADAVERELALQLDTLPTRDVARTALANGFSARCASRADAARLVQALAPEHLEVVCEGASDFAATVDRYGALFLGENGAEVLGDYGAGPNHTLPTGGTARFSGPLGVQTFLVARTWMAGRSNASLTELARDAARLADLEGLAGHARAAHLRAGSRP
ncbi:Histidinol dehydrogenase [Planctomycetes bacterium Pla163]|uniref:Histidinol dehydrogenase n=1 Tax=Rohdeia mirabilis TaxID=2528008 RepID=A0A518D2I7_9BACT|nr:Histidinol dehydrogenase [Planctomycetes bacterium Pla163]